MSSSKERRIPVMEIFGPTIQGEGLMTGTLTNFVRTGGCGLRCKWCDTMFAVDPHQVRAGRTMMTDGQIYNAILDQPYAPYVTFSGGDPCLHETLGGIFPALNLKGIQVAIETQGELFPEWLTSADVVTFSPKPPSSGNVVNYHDIIAWIHDHWGLMRRPVQICIKVVVFDEEDFQYALNVYKGFHPNLYDSFYFTAGTPGPFVRTAPVAVGVDVETEEVPEESAEVLEARSMQKLLGVAGGQRWLADRFLMEAHHNTNQTKFNYKVHIGSQQHVVIWPEMDRGR